MGERLDHLHRASQERDGDKEDLVRSTTELRARLVRLT